MRFEISPDVFEKLPELYLGALFAKNLDNSKGSHDFSSLLNAGFESVRTRLDASYREDHAIKVYRDAFLELGINPNRFMVSIDAMVKRILGGSDLPSINPVVDISNAMSLKYLVALGAHDVDIVKSGAISVRFSDVGDRFLPLGETEYEVLDSGELVYADGGEINTRRWIWRQSNNCKITENSKNIFFPIDGFYSTKDAVDGCAAELSALLKQHFGCEVSAFTLDKNHTSIEF